jgi:protein-S-isoprenylcysteine O-methyltransferase Ste14
MKSLELKVHPPIVQFLCLCLVYVLSHFLPILAIPSTSFGLHWFVGFTGVLMALVGIWEFLKAQTTIDPTRPEKSSHLISSGIYQVTRNPMYLGMVIIIVAAIIKFANYYGFIALPCFILYITQFQIKPEERIIEGIFGNDYVYYKNRVRRWL